MNRIALIVLLGITQHIDLPPESIAITHGEGKSLFRCIKALKVSVEMSRMAWHPRGEKQPQIRVGPALPANTGAHWRSFRDQERMEAEARAALDAVDDACGVGTEGEP